MMRPVILRCFSGAFTRLNIAALLPQILKLAVNYRMLRIVWFSELFTSRARELAWKLR